MHLLYIADPLCSWCYGFGPQLARVLERHPDTVLELVMGGLRPFNREPMSPAFRDMLLGHWKHVADASGLPFSDDNLHRDGWAYDTEPACRAVVAARAMDYPRAFAFMEAVQDAFYRGGRDVTRDEVLADVAAQSGFDRGVFLAKLQSDEMRQRTLADFAAAQALGVTGFPTLGVKRAGQVFLVTSGFAASDVLEERLARIADLAGAER
jgi:putative protein-disulfide isomerase